MKASKGVKYAQHALKPENTVPYHGGRLYLLKYEYKVRHLTMKELKNNQKITVTVYDCSTMELESMLLIAI